MFRVFDDKHCRIKVYNDKRYITALNGYDRATKPYLFPLVTPLGINVGAEGTIDHAFHKSLFVGHRNVNEIDFWCEPGGDGEIRLENEY